MKSRVALVTGSSGFIGLGLCKALSLAGWVVVGVDISNNSQEHVNYFVCANTAELQHNQIKDFAIDVIFDCACYADSEKCEHEQLSILDSCYLGTKNLLELAKQTSSKYVYLSTTDVTKDYSHDAGKSAYVLGKLTAERLCKIYSKHVNVCVVRLNNVYGEFKQSDLRVIPTFIKSTKNNLTPSVVNDACANFCYLPDVVEKLIEIAVCDSNKFIYEFSGETTSIKNLAMLVKEVVSLKTPIKYGLADIV